MLSALQLIAERAPAAFVRVHEAITTIRSVRTGSGMDVFSKTYLVGDETAFAPGFSMPESTEEERASGCGWVLRCSWDNGF